jgi:hypothetical protein
MFDNGVDTISAGVEIGHRFSIPNVRCVPNSGARADVA